MQEGVNGVHRKNTLDRSETKGRNEEHDFLMSPNRVPGTVLGLWYTQQ